MHGWAPEVINAVGRPEPDPGGYLDVFFTSSPASRQAGQEALGRIYGRTVDVDEFASWSSRLAQYDAVCDWGILNHAALQRVSAISHPVFIANGDRDPMILPHFSYLLAGLIPQAKIKIYPDAAHGFLFQHATEFAADVNAFLNDCESDQTKAPADSGNDVNPHSCLPARTIRRGPGVLLITKTSYQSRFSNPVSTRGSPTCAWSICLTQCPPDFVSRPCPFSGCVRSAAYRMITERPSMGSPHGIDRAAFVT